MTDRSVESPTEVASCEPFAPIALSLRRQLLHFDPKPSLINADGAVLLEEEEGKEEKKASMLLPNKFRQIPCETLCPPHPPTYASDDDDRDRAWEMGCGLGGTFWLWSLT